MLRLALVALLQRVCFDLARLGNENLECILEFDRDVRGSRNALFQYTLMTLCHRQSWDIQ